MEIIETNAFHTFYANPDDTVKITCPECGLSKSFDINDDRPDKSVKTEDRRLVPLHPFLVEDLGFVR